MNVIIANQRPQYKWSNVQGDLQVSRIVYSQKCPLIDAKDINKTYDQNKTEEEK